nr:carbonic anhydrase 2-like [Ciona intestinalis]|eukprot:XP_002127899.1 carbonic anhydrase 2-like [Ciona intestinalis]
MMKVTVIALLLVIDQAIGATWVYSQGPKGPSNWLNSYAACGTRAQSPISIEHENSVANKNLGTFDRSVFTSLPASMELVNNGHALQVNMDGSYTISDRSVLPNDYKAVQFHLHWAAANKSEGSEHWLNGKQYFAELHVVHYNTKYASIGEAVNKPDGLAVLGVFVDINDETNEHFNLLLNPINRVQIPNQEMTYTSKFSVANFLPTDLSEYYRYRGSLTTPPCFDSVVWTVFKEPIHMSRDQARVLQTSLYDGINSTAKVGGNFRLPQPINGREVSRPYKSGANPIPLPIFLQITAMLAVVKTLYF